MAFTATWLELEVVILSEVTQEWKTKYVFSVRIQSHKIIQWPLGTRGGRLGGGWWIKDCILGMGALAQACNASIMGGRCRWVMRSKDQDYPGQHGETLSLLKIQKISWAWWRVPVISATQEAEAGELPELRRRRLRWAEIAPLHYSLGNRSETLSQKKIK